MWALMKVVASGPSANGVASLLSAGVDEMEKVGQLPR
jgi:hypothetical protein